MVIFALFAISFIDAFENTGDNCPTLAKVFGNQLHIPAFKEAIALFLTVVSLWVQDTLEILHWTNHVLMLPVTLGT
jgi:hypothetical protein